MVRNRILLNNNSALNSSREYRDVPDFPWISCQVYLITRCHHLVAVLGLHPEGAKRLLVAPEWRWTGRMARPAIGLGSCSTRQRCYDPEQVDAKAWGSHGRGNEGKDPFCVHGEQLSTLVLARPDAPLCADLCKKQPASAGFLLPGAGTFRKARGPWWRPSWRI